MLTTFYGLTSFHMRDPCFHWFVLVKWFTVYLFFTRFVFSFSNFFFFSFYNTRMYDIPRLHDRRSGRNIRGQEESLIWKAVGHVSVCVSCWSSTTRDSIYTFSLSFSFSYTYPGCITFVCVCVWVYYGRPWKGTDHLADVFD